MKKSFLITLLIFLLIVVIFFLSLKPHLSPEDISLSYDVKNSLGTENHNLNLTLDIKRKDIKYTEKSFYHVYVFPNENSKYIYTEYLNVSQEDIHIGTDIRTYHNALRALENTKLHYIDEAKNKANPFDGFFYTGNDYPIKVKTYYSRIDDTQEEKVGYIVFSYYEKKVFKNLSWVIVYPFKL